MIRRATIDDAEEICDLHIRSIRVLCFADYTPQQIEAWAGRKKPELYSRAMTEGGETMFVAVDEQQGRIIGFAAFKEAEIYGLYVAPEAVRRGVGSALLDAAEAAMRSNGVTLVKFRSTLTALSFYQCHGYVRGDDAIARMGGVDVPCVWMSKTL
jgi:ribosomal protein S18 acetylase RimI-like enzyme